MPKAAVIDVLLVIAACLSGTLEEQIRGIARERGECFAEEFLASFPADLQRLPSEMTHGAIFRNLLPGPLGVVSGDGGEQCDQIRLRSGECQTEPCLALAYDPSRHFALRTARWIGEEHTHTLARTRTSGWFTGRFVMVANQEQTASAEITDGYWLRGNSAAGESGVPTNRASLVGTTFPAHYLSLVPPTP